MIAHSNHVKFPPKPKPPPDTRPASAASAVGAGQPVNQHYYAPCLTIQQLNLLPSRRCELTVALVSTNVISKSTLRAILAGPVSYTHLRAHETVLDLVCRLLLE